MRMCVHMCEHVCVPLCEHMCVFEQTSALVISKILYEASFWNSTVAAKQMCTPNCSVHRCMINSSVKQAVRYLYNIMLYFKFEVNR